VLFLMSEVPMYPSTESLCPLDPPKAYPSGGEWVVFHRS